MNNFKFKTLYFSAGRTVSNKATRITISIPDPSTFEEEKRMSLEMLRVLTGTAILEILGDPWLEDLEKSAQHNGRSLSSECIQRFLRGVTSSKPVRSVTDAQGQLPLSYATSPDSGETAFGVTFRDSKRLPIHSWYPYVEGFSANYVHECLTRFGSMPESVYDPFGGSGTTQVASSTLGVRSYFSELNPFMRFVAETKIESSSWARANLGKARKVFNKFVSELSSDSFICESVKVSLIDYEDAFPGRDFFRVEDIQQLLYARSAAERIGGRYRHLRQLLLLACAANIVDCSNMTRRADLRRRRPDEYKGRIVNVPKAIVESALKMIAEIEFVESRNAPMEFISGDARSLPESATDIFDMAITSPPYLNGTNYFRNTKLELWFMGFIKSEKDLAGFRSQTVCGGINDVSNDREAPNSLDSVQEVVDALNEVTKDSRIPRMIAYYFDDMRKVFNGVYRSLRAGSRFVLDIGDSCFYGVHVPTDKLLIEVGEACGFEVEAQNFLAKRYSKSRVKLEQTEIVFRKRKMLPTGTAPHRKNREFHDVIKMFHRDLPYRKDPYTKRNWGHPLHSLCSFQGKLKPSIAYWLIRTFVPSNGSVLDLLGGVGTIPFEAAMAGRYSVSNDMSPFASIVARAKLDPPELDEALHDLQDLAKRFSATRVRQRDVEAAMFGLNAKVVDYYHPDTLTELLKARRVFAETKEWTRGQCFIWASLLHILHGNRPYALSRRSHPITPFSPTGPVEYKSVVVGIENRIRRSLAQPLPESFQAGLGVHGDFRLLSKKVDRKFDAIITSPPFAGMRFDRPNWLRLWFCGWGESSFHRESLGFLERQQSKSLDCYEDFFEVCKGLLTESGVLIVHMGGSERDRMPEKLAEIGGRHLTLIANMAESVEDAEGHGLSDKGRTTAHHYIYFRN